MKSTLPTLSSGRLRQLDKLGSGTSGHLLLPSTHLKWELLDFISRIICSTGRPRRRVGDRDHPSIEERVQRERPCRTLFIRNVTVRRLLWRNVTLCSHYDQFEADSEGLRASFAGFGDIKTYFDLVKNRGMIFITYVYPFGASYEN